MVRRIVGLVPTPTLHRWVSWRVLAAVACTWTTVTGCEADPEVRWANTQVMLRTYNNDAELREAMVSLRAQLYLQQGNQWEKRTELVLPKGDLEWPVDIPVLPPERGDFAVFELIVEALGVKSQVLAQARVVSSFIPEERKVIEAWLFFCPGHDGAFVCQNQKGCHGGRCVACTNDGECTPVGRTDPRELADLDPSQKPPPKEQPDLDPAYSLAEVGAPCESGAKACPAHASGTPLRCSASHTWELAEPCAPNARCQSASKSPFVGTCQTVLAGCAEKEPGALTCEGDVRRACGPDLLSYDDAPECEDGFSCADGDCVNIDECAETPKVCTHGGLCTDAQPGYQCSGCASGSTASNELFPTCADIDECAAQNVCTASYPCRNLDPDYTCRGLFPDWTVSQSHVFSKSDGVVFDVTSGLTWQAETGRASSRQAAIDACDDLVLGSADDWRLPTLTELLSLVDYTTFDPAIDVTFFPRTMSADYWSSSPLGDSSSQGWRVDMADGVARPEFIAEAGFIRCVR